MHAYTLILCLMGDTLVIRMEIFFLTDLFGALHYNFMMIMSVRFFYNKLFSMKSEKLKGQTFEKLASSTFVFFLKYQYFL